MTPFPDLVRTFGRVGLLSFGGPAAQIALMHRALVDERRWLTESEYLRALSFCMLLPGPEAMQLATYAGWKLRGIAGGVVAGLLFVLPGAAVIAVLAVLYARYGAQPDTEALLQGVQAAVIAIVVQAMVRLSRRALSGPGDVALAFGAFAALFVLSLPFPVVIAAAALIGAWRARGTVPPDAPVLPDRAGTRPATLALWAGAWLLPLPVLWLLDARFLFEIAGFFAMLAVVTFGGAYAVLAWMAQAVVETRGWLTPDQMVDALGLAETTPGPLILVTQFVGHLAGFASGGLALGLFAGALTLWMTFVPCFLWIFAFAPHVERLLHRPRLQGALAGITAAVVGVIGNLSLWFAFHVLFAIVAPVALGGVEMTLPDPFSLRPSAVLLTAVAGAALWRGVPVAAVIALCAGLGWGMGQL